MATAKVRTVSVELDRVRTLRMDFNALSDAEELTGLNLLDPAEWEKLNIRGIRALLFACCKHEDPDVTPEIVGAAIHPGNIQEVTTHLLQLYAGAMPEPGAEVPSDPLGMSPAAEVTS